MSVESTHVFICDVCDKRVTNTHGSIPDSWITASLKTDGTVWQTEFLVCGACRNKENQGFFKMVWALMYPRKGRTDG